MNHLIVFFVGAVAATVSEVFWKGESRWHVALWGGIGMLILRRIVLRFPFESRTLLCFFGAVQLIALRLTIIILSELSKEKHKGKKARPTVDMPSFTYSLYRFLLIAPAYTIIEYLETCFRI